MRRVTSSVPGRPSATCSTRRRGSSTGAGSSTMVPRRCSRHEGGAGADPVGGPGRRVKKASRALVGLGVKKRVVATTLAALLGWVGIGARASALESEPAGAEAPDRHAAPARLHPRPGVVLAARRRGLGTCPGEHAPRAGRSPLCRARAARSSCRSGRAPSSAPPEALMAPRSGCRASSRDYLQLKVTAGTLSLDLRDVPPGETVDVNTPAGVLTVERAGYYRIEAGADRTAFLADRGGAATLTIEDGGEGAGRAERAGRDLEPGRVGWRSRRAGAERLGSLELRAHRRAPDRRERTVRAVRHLRRQRPGPSWQLAHRARVRPRLGAGRRAAGWAPYSTGRWIWDPHFEWTWVDDAPWGWAPYHHGRWVRVGDTWAWAPGPIVARPHYAPALVAFFQPVVVTVSRPVSWVALGWGEPCVPWWGRSRHAGRPWWGGWGGPRLARAHRNADVHHAVVTVPSERFGRGPVDGSRLRSADVTGLQPLHGALGIRPTPGSLVPRDRSGREADPVEPPERRGHPPAARRVAEAPCRRAARRPRPGPASRRRRSSWPCGASPGPRSRRRSSLRIALALRARSRGRRAADVRGGQPPSVRDRASASGPALARPSSERRGLLAPAPDPSPRRTDRVIRSAGREARASCGASRARAGSAGPGPRRGPCHRRARALLRPRAGQKPRRPALGQEGAGGDEIAGAGPALPALERPGPAAGRPARSVSRARFPPAVDPGPRRGSAPARVRLERGPVPEGARLALRPAQRTRMHAWARSGPRRPGRRRSAARAFRRPAG